MRIINATAAFKGFKDPFCQRLSKILALVLSIVSISQLTFGDDRSLCVDREIRLTKWLSELRPMSDLSRNEKIQHADIIFIGENHDTNIQSKYPELISILREASPQINCLYLEGHQSALTTIQQIQRGEIVDPKEPLLQYKDLFALGLKVLMVDNHWTRDRNVDVTAALQWVIKNPDKNEYVYRNHVIGEEIKRSLDSGACNRGIMIAGYQHLINYQGRREALVSKLSNLKTATILAFDTGIAARSSNSFTPTDPRWNWSHQGCPSSLPIATSSGYSTTRSLENVPLVRFLSNNIGNWSDFDFAFTSPSK